MYTNKNAKQNRLMIKQNHERLQLSSLNLECTS